MKGLVPVEMDHDAVCLCGHGRTLHQVGRCAGCGAWDVIPWRDSCCCLFVPAGSSPRPFVQAAHHPQEHATTLR